MGKRLNYKMYKSVGIKNITKVRFRTYQLRLESLLLCVMQNGVYDWNIHNLSTGKKQVRKAKYPKKI